MLEKIEYRLIVVNNYLLKTNRIKLIFFAVSLNIFFSLIFSFISEKIFNEKISIGFKSLGTIYDEIILVILIAPFFETLLFQYSIIEFIRKKFNPFVCCCVSAMVFSLMHTYNVFYFFFAFFSGFLFAYLYYLGNTIKTGILLAFIVHLIHNSIAFLIKNWSKLF